MRFLLVLLVSSLALAQSANDLAVRNYRKKLLEEHIETGQRHVDLGWSIKDSGLIPQATYQFVLAVELSAGEHKGAAMVLNIVRTYEEAFWRKRRKKPWAGALAAYEKKAEKLVEKDRDGQIDLARAAWKAKLEPEAKEHLITAMEFGAEVEFDPKGKATIGRFKVEDALLPWLREQTVEIEGGVRVIDPARLAARGKALPGAAAPGPEPDLTGMHDVVGNGLLLRSDLEPAVVQDMHRLCVAAFAPLRDRLDGAPTRVMRVMVFQKRADYDAYLKARGFGDVVSAGYCAYGAMQALLCAEGLDEGSRNALLLHEFSHLFFFGSSPIAMPDWYAEGFAETFGGVGTFTWRDGVLEVGGRLRSDVLATIQQQPMTLQQVLAGNAVNLLRQDKDAGHRFYAMSWALMRWLSTVDHPYRERFEAWEGKCRGALPGRDTTRGFGSPAAATESFLQEFEGDLEAMEQAFAVWLKEL